MSDQEDEKQGGNARNLLFTWGGNYTGEQVWEREKGGVFDYLPLKFSYIRMNIRKCPAHQRQHISAQSVDSRATSNETFSRAESSDGRTKKR